MDILNTLSRVAIDTALIAFAKNNMLTIAAGYGVLKVLAKATPSAKDDKIIAAIGAWLGVFRRKGGA